jgi:hypothetical protein
MSTLGFILTRHVNSNKTDRLWRECYRCIRNHHPTATIVIIDDNSQYEFITPILLTNCWQIQSEFPARGEILAYYYYHKYRFPFEKAVVIHDSTFLQKPLFAPNVPYVSFWHFEHTFDQPLLEIPVLQTLENIDEDFIHFYGEKKWHGCFGVQCIIDLAFLDKIVAKYDVFRLIDMIHGRNERYHIERIWGALCCRERGEDSPSLLGKIHQYGRGWEYQFETYQEELQTGALAHLPLLKVWSGR